MKILGLDRKKGLINLAVDNTEDLWHLYNIIFKEDLVYSRTTREIKTRDKSGQVVDSRRIPLTLGLKVTEVAFDKNINRLRIRGKVIEVSEKFKDVRSSYHTLSIQPNSKFTIIKSNLTDYNLRRIELACKTKPAPIIVISVDDEEICIAAVRRFDIDVKYESRFKLPGKREADKRKEAEQTYFADITKTLQEVLKHVKGQLVIVGPGFLKDRLAIYIKEKLRSDTIHIASASSAGLSGINEAVRSGVLLKIIKENRFLQEAQLVESFFAILASDEKKIAYGLPETEAATRYGAIERLLVVDKFLREASDEAQTLETIIREVEQKNGSQKQGKINDLLVGYCKDDPECEMLQILQQAEAKYERAKELARWTRKVDNSYSKDNIDHLLKSKESIRTV